MTDWRRILSRRKKIPRQPAAQPSVATAATGEAVSSSSSQCLIRSPTIHNTASLSSLSHPSASATPTIQPTIPPTEPPLPDPISSSSPPLPRSPGASNTRCNQKRQGRIGTWSSALNIRTKWYARWKLTRLFGMKSYTKDHDCIFTVEIETTSPEKRTIIVRALVDTGCEYKGILLSKRTAERAGLPDKETCPELDDVEFGTANGDRMQGQSSEGCEVLWAGARPEKNLSYRLPRRYFVQSHYAICDGLSCEVIIGQPEIARLRLHKTQLPFIGPIVAEPPTPDSSKEAEAKKKGDKEEFNRTKKQREKDKAASAQRARNGNANNSNPNSSNT